MLTLEEARERILADLTPLGSEAVDLLSARDRVLAQEVVAGRAVPGFQNSAMDGYAVIAADTEGAEERAVTLRVTSTIPAGAVPAAEVKRGEAARIFTGAPLPPGADAVVAQEDTTRSGDDVTIRCAAHRGKHVRQQGEDIRPGDVLLPAGCSVTPGDIGVLAGQGRMVVQVVRRPRVAIVPTGDEVREIDLALGPGDVPNSNSWLIAAQVEEAGGIPLRLPVVPDDPQAIREQLVQAATSADLVITSGGVSVGDFDHVKEVLGESGRVDFWRVAIKPGKPLAYGRLQRVPFIGLPGNPVSSFVTFELFARPALRRLAGAPQVLRPVREVRLSRELRPNRGRRELVRAQLQTRRGELWATPHPRQGSGAMSSMTQVDALLDIPPGGQVLGGGHVVQALVLNPNIDTHA